MGLRYVRRVIRTVDRNDACSRIYRAMGERMTPDEKIMLARWVGIAVVFVFVGLAFATVDRPKRRI